VSQHLSALERETQRKLIERAGADLSDLPHQRTGDRQLHRDHRLEVLNRHIHDRRVSGEIARATRDVNPPDVRAGEAVLRAAGAPAGVSG
jgi:hypothetical protein